MYPDPDSEVGTSVVELEEIRFPTSCPSLCLSLKDKCKVNPIFSLKLNAKSKFYFLQLEDKTANFDEEGCNICEDFKQPNYRGKCRKNCTAVYGGKQI